MMNDNGSTGATEVEITLHFSNGGRLAQEDLLVIAAIRNERSILGASRATGISYRKCWLIVDALNRTFEAPVFATFPGRRGGGAELTPFGERLVALYSSIERKTRSQARSSIEEISASLNPNYEPRSSGAASEVRRP